MPEATGGMPTIEEVNAAHAEHFRQAHPGWEERRQRDWEPNRRVFQALVIKGANARGLFDIAWMAGFKAGLEERS